MTSRALPILLVSALALAFAPVPLPAAAATAPDSGPARPFAAADLSLGADSYQRRFVSPSLRFSIPWRAVRLFTDLTFEQTSNRDVEGELDFWLRVLAVREVARGVTVEAGINHLSRHLTSRANPVIFDVNEFAAKAWLGTERFRVAGGGGFYIGKQAGYESLATADVEAQRLFGTELSLRAGWKFANGGRTLYDYELRAAVTEGAELFVRRVKRYELEPITFVGLRFRAAGEGGGGALEKARLQLGVLPFDDRHKLVSSEELRLRLLSGPRSRLLLSIGADIPVTRTEPFFGAFRPDTLTYPVALEIERGLGQGFYALGWIRFRTDLPLDVPQPFEARLAAGVGLRNQPDFERLDKPFRFEVLFGKELGTGLQGWVRGGVNTVGRLAAGAQVRMSSLPAERRFRAEGFLDLDRGVHVRPFLGLESIYHPSPRPESSWRLLTGITMLEWF